MRIWLDPVGGDPAQIGLNPGVQRIVDRVERDGLDDIEVVARAVLEDHLDEDDVLLAELVAGDVLDIRGERVLHAFGDARDRLLEDLVALHAAGSAEHLGHLGAVERGGLARVGGEDIAKVLPVGEDEESGAIGLKAAVRQALCRGDRGETRRKRRDYKFGGHSGLLEQG